jgi:PAS domain S-box-containing protein
MAPSGLSNDMMSDCAQSLLQLAIEQETEHAFILLDEQGTILSWAGAAAKMFGYDAAEMCEHTLERLLTPEDLERGKLANELGDHKSGQADDGEERFARLESWARERWPLEDVIFRWSGQVMEPLDGMAFIGRNPMEMTMSTS